MSAFSLTLQHTRGVGDLLPYFEGLAIGAARATRCAQCAQAWFAPRLVCPRGHTDLQWIALPGTGIIRSVTQTKGTLPFGARERRLVLAWVAMDGADNLVFGRIDPAADVCIADRVRLVADSEVRGGRAWSVVFELAPPGS